MAVSLLKKRLQNYAKGKLVARAPVAQHLAMLFHGLLTDKIKENGMNEIGISAIQPRYRVAEYIPPSWDDPEVTDPPPRKCQCGCGRELPLYKRRVLMELKRKAHRSYRYHNSCWRRIDDERISRIPNNYCLKSHGRDKDGPNIRKPASGILDT